MTTCNSDHQPPERAVNTTGHTVLRYIISKNCPFQWRIINARAGTKEVDKKEPLERAPEARLRRRFKDSFIQKLSENRKQGTATC